MGEVRDARGRFRPGMTGNAGGRPRGIASAVREGADVDALIATLYSIAKDPIARAADRISAVRELLDRGWGKAPAFQPMEGSDPLEMSELDRAIREIAAQFVGRCTETLEAN